jgi:flagellar motor protein MotB
LVPSKSLSQAVIWYKKSAEKGYSGAKKRLDELGVEIPKTSAKNMAETIFFLSDDLKSGIKYFNKTAKAQQNNSFLFNSPIDRKKIMYARPENYTWSNEKKENTDYDVLTFPNTNGYAYLERLNDNDSFLFKISETKYRLIVDGSYCVGDNCLTDENIISVVMPKRFKVISYKANVDGDWKIVDSTYTYYAQNIKGVTLTIEFEDLFAVVYDNVFQKMKKFEKVEVENKEGEIQVRMPLDNVFQPGEISIKNNQAKEWIKQLASSVVNSKYKEFRVEGHADSIPLKKGSVYPSNWELSAARAAVALRLLIESGVPSSKLAAVGYGDSRPIGDNKTSTGRAKNRRIEFKIIPES